MIINGPNINLVGVREPDIYGSRSFEDYFNSLNKHFPQVGLFHWQSNIEGEIIGKIQECGFQFDFIILNAGAYAHTSVAIGDAITAIKTPVIEVHISNIFARESFRKKSFIASKCIGSISGFGLHSYHLAVEACVLQARK